MIYLDNAATALPRAPGVGRAMAWAAENLSSPSRGMGKPSEQAEELLMELRQRAGRMFHCPPEQVVLTSSATHGLNIAIKSLVKAGDRVVISSVEHNAVLRPLYALGANIVTAGDKLFDREGFLSDLDRRLTKDTKACILTHVSNVFGWILPVEEAAALCRERNIPFVLDASQSAGILPVDMKKLGAAFVAMPGHKGLLGPQGTGLLLCGGAARPLMEGGTGSLSLQREMPEFLPDRLEPGTHNIPGAAGLLMGLRFLEKQKPGQLLRREQAHRKYLTERLREVPGAEIFYGEDQTGVLSFRVDGRDTVLLGEKLAEKGFTLRAGFHCAPLAHETAGTLKTGTVRVSPGAFTTRAQVEALGETLRIM